MLPIVRQLNIQNALDASQIQFMAFKNDFSKYMPQAIIENISSDDLHAQWSKRLASPTDRQWHFGVFLEDLLIGTCSIGSPRDENNYDVELWAMYIRKDFQGKSYGRHLLVQVAHELTKLRVTSMYLKCIENNEGAVEFYKSLGGVLLNTRIERKGYWEIVFAWENIGELS